MKTFKTFREETLNELSANTIKKYGRKASADMRREDGQGRALPFDKLKKRADGINTARKKLTGKSRVPGTIVRKEEVDIQELSKETLGSYLKKAEKSLDGPSLDKETFKAGNKKQSHKVGIKTAKKLTKEETEINELSIHKLVNYSVAARNDALNHSRFRKRNTTPADEKRVKKRMKGDDLAGKKLDRAYKGLKT